jgi:LAS superfamily LD-carboxypeptidase LdcB
MYVDSSRTYIGIVEDNNDPKKLGRCRIRVIDIFDEIPVQDIPWASPWKDLNGNGFNVPEKGKILTVIFDSGNIYKPEYVYAEHYNINLENKLKSLEGKNYTSMKSLIFDHKTQIYVNDEEGLKIDNVFTNLNLDKNGNILLNLRDNKSIITMGSVDADEEAVLGTTFMAWFDDFVSNLIGEQSGPYLGNLGAPVVANPALITILQRYREMRSKFVSKHVRISKNDNIIAQDREAIGQEGDSYRTSNTQNSISTINNDFYRPSSKIIDEETGDEVDYKPLGSSTPDNPANYNPADFRTSVEYDVPTSTLDRGKYENGKLPLNILLKSKWANGERSGKWVTTQIRGKDNAYLTKEAANAFDALFSLYESVVFPGKSPIIISDGYRTFSEQEACYRKYGAGFAAKPGTSNHGWALAVDIAGISSPFSTIKKNPKDRASAYRTPVYQWLFANSWKFGIYNPWTLRDGTKVDEYWHWEFHGNKGEPSLANKFAPAQYSDYSKVFTKQDEVVLRRNGVSQPSAPYLKDFLNRNA